MSFKAKIAAGAATFALAGGGLGTAGTLSASAATPSCGSKCQDLSTLKFGSGYLLDTFRGRAAANQEVILFRASNSDPAEDFVIHDLGTVGSLNDHHRHLITPQFDHAYHSLDTIQIQYAPLGRKSGFCASTWPGEIARPGFKVRLEPCGQYSNSNSIWAVFNGYQASDQMAPVSPGYGVLINGATDSVSHPLVLNYPAGYPTDMPRPWLNVQPLNDHPDRTVFNNQQWTYVGGPVHGGM
jgi:hypothetical protein